MIPAEPERVARAAFPKGRLIMCLCDEIGMLMPDRNLAHRFPSPSRLLFGTIFQVIEGLTNRQATDAVRRWSDGKDALALELPDPGVPGSVLQAVRDRRLAVEQGQVLRDTFLGTCRAQGLVTARGKPRTDASHVLGAIRRLNRLACLGEPLAHTLHQRLRMCRQRHA